MCVSVYVHVCRYKYKEDYERFKVYLSMIILVLALLLWFMPNFRYLIATVVQWASCTKHVPHILQNNK